MKRFGVVIIMFMLIGCASTRNTINRLQGDVAYFQDELVKYSIILEDNEYDKANSILKDAKEILSRAESAALIGDKITEKKYLSALVDIMDLLPEPEK